MAGFRGLPTLIAEMKKRKKRREDSPFPVLYPTTFKTPKSTGSYGTAFSSDIPAFGGGKGGGGGGGMMGASGGAGGGTVGGK